MIKYETLKYHIYINYNKFTAQSIRYQGELFLFPICFRNSKKNLSIQHLRSTEFQDIFHDFNNEVWMGLLQFCPAVCLHNFSGLGANEIHDHLL